MREAFVALVSVDGRFRRTVRANSRHNEFDDARRASFPPCRPPNRAPRGSRTGSERCTPGGRVGIAKPCLVNDPASQQNPSPRE